MRWRRQQLFRAAAWGLFWLVGLAAMLEWRATSLSPRQPVPASSLMASPSWLAPALTGVMVIFMLAYWDAPLARGMFGGMAAAQAAWLLLSWTGATSPLA